MKKTLKSLFIAVLFVLGVAAPVATVATPTNVLAACDDRVLGIPPWYRGLTEGSDCSIKGVSGSGDNGDGLSSFIWTIALNVVEMVIVIIAYISVGFILYGGFLFMTGGGSPAMIEKARKTLTNAVIGLIISMASIGIVNFIFSIIT